MSNSILITVFTPTFNRENLLGMIFNDLSKQNSKNFEWLIIDDGSTDGTKEIIKDFQKKTNFPINYYYKKNGGKHSAINFGVKKAKGELFVMVDSDDSLTENALNILTNTYCKIQNNAKICGILGLSIYENNEVIGNKFIKDNWEVSFADIYLKYKIKGDKFVSFKTSVLSKYPFPEEENIIIVSEDVVWHEMSKKYKVLCLNTALQYKEYREGGLTLSITKDWYRQGMAFSYFHLIKNRTYPFFKYPKVYLKTFINLALSSMLANKSYFNRLNLFPDKFVYLLLYPKARINYKRNLKELNKNI